MNEDQDSQTQPQTRGRKRLDEIVAGPKDVPRVVETLRLGLLDTWAPGHVKKRWEPAPEILNTDGSMFGGMIAALADQVLTFATLSVVPGDKAFRTINLGVQFFKVTHAQPLVIEAQVLAQSKRVICVEATFAHDDGTLIAKATAQQAILPFPTA